MHEKQMVDTWFHYYATSNHMLYISVKEDEVTS